MKLKEYLEVLNKMVAKNLELLEAEVLTYNDDSSRECYYYEKAEIPTMGTFEYSGTCHFDIYDFEESKTNINSICL